MEELNSRAGQHRISLVNREVCAINGVSDVLSFDVGEVLLETEQGMLMIRGSELHVSRLRGNVLAAFGFAGDGGDACLRFSADFPKSISTRNILDFDRGSYLLVCCGRQLFFPVISGK